MSGGYSVLTALSALYPWEVEASEDLVESLSFIQAKCSAETVVRAGFGAGFVVLFVGALPAIMLFRPLLAITVISLLAFLTIHAIHSGPKLLAAFGRIEALGQSPNLIGRIVLRMQIQPATEMAVQFAADTGFGPLSRSLETHIDRARGTPRTGLISFADEWGDIFPAIRRSSHLLSTAQDATEEDRERTLDRSLEAVLDGTRDQMADFTESIRAPSTFIYSFGVMIPLALVALAPAASLAGIEVTTEAFIIIYNILLPIILIGLGLWLLIRRPVAFPPPKVTREHPDVPNSIRGPILLGIAGGIGLFVITTVLGLALLAPVSALGFGLGLALFGIYRPVAMVRAHVRAVERHLVDALYIAGRQVDEGEAVESAIDLAAKRVPGETGVVFGTASRLQNELRLTVEEAFLGTYGALNDIPSPRAYGTVSLLSIAASEGQPAGKAIVSMADHLEDLQDVERVTRRELSEVTGTLHHTAMVFAPLVAGSTIALAGGMVDQQVEGIGNVPVEALAVIVGVYLIMLCLILTPLSVGLRYGLDKALIGYEVSKALLVAAPLYVLTVFVVGLVI